MTYRQQLRPIFQRMPRLALLVMVATSLPAWLIIGEFLGVWQAACEWRRELIRIEDLDE